ncbi:gephyrin-like molybdotransferase Glp [Rhodocista pekingensis]|uniref:Molybdopterin molybdenumtransferase n=1 Tax=Rhodocista pekingensis TaxID=201185 RepID=A0ABW2KQQ1_9PROT
MAPLPDDRPASAGPILPVARAEELLRDRFAPVAPIERVPLPAALDRVLAEEVVAALDVPPQDSAAVDGYAVRHADLEPDAGTTLPLVARIAAGHPAAAAGEKGAVRIFTGARLPAGFDTVVMQEDARAEGASVVLPAGIEPGANRRRAGEDVRKGTAILRPGRRLRPQDIGLAASVGATRLAVRSPLRVAVLSTGDEIVDPASLAGRPLPPAAVFDSNRYTVTALLRRLGCDVTDLGIVPDAAPAMREALTAAARRHDLVVSSGGVSEGEEDHVRAALQAAGHLDFWRLAIKPGRPVALGRIGETPVVGLPGSPVAAMIAFLTLVRPLVHRLQGCEAADPPPFPVRAAFAYTKKPDRRDYLRVTLTRAADGTLEARRLSRDGSAVLSAMVEADGLVELDEAVTAVAEGDMVPCLPLGSLF